jgi:isopentenyl-diphosphate delta-isomerase
MALLSTKFLSPLAKASNQNLPRWRAAKPTANNHGILMVETSLSMSESETDQQSGKVILVDERDQEIGVSDKLAAHREGKLHRAFSIFIFNQKGEMLLQKRSLPRSGSVSDKKYHSGGLWSNACCSHPRPGESMTAAAARRLHEELGITCDLKKAFDFIYLAPLNNQLVEHEFAHVFVGRYRGRVHPNADEVQEYRWVSPEALNRELLYHPKRFTIWFKIAVKKMFEIQHRKTNGGALSAKRIGFRRDNGVWE